MVKLEVVSRMTDIWVVLLDVSSVHGAMPSVGFYCQHMAWSKR